MADASTSPSRTDPVFAESHRLEKAHLHRRLHSKSLRNKETQQHRHGTGAKDVVQSAVELRPPVSFDQLLRRDKKDHDSAGTDSGGSLNHHHHHRHNHNLQHTPQRENNESTAQQQTHQADKEKRRVKANDVIRAKERNARREEALRGGLKEVEDLAMSCTRQLDDTFYSILEKASVLRSTVVSLQQLAEECRRMHGSFQGETSRLEAQTRQSASSYDDFNSQEKSIDVLVTKLSTSKLRTEKLNERLEEARRRAEMYEEQGVEQRRARRNRWRIGWVVLLGVVCLLLAIAIVRHQSATHGRHSVRTLFDELGNVIGTPGMTIPKANISPSEDPYLRRLFDEL